jgi:ribosomal protein S18 acetylase RimI-like enzyme
LVEFFWGEPEQTAFNKTILIKEQPAFVAISEDKVAGFIAYCEIDNEDMLIAALGVLPQYQGYGIGKALVSAVEEKARKLSKKRILVSTSNDDLPALAFYQLMGFQIFEVAPNIIAEKHGTIYKGIGNIPIRDEIRLQKVIK